MKACFAFCILVMQFISWNGLFANFLGGTISWRTIRNNIHFTVRTTWDKGTGPCGSSCSSSNIGTTNPSNPYSNIFWQYDNGTNTGMNLDYVLTTVNNDLGFEQGEKRFIMPIPSVPSFTIRLMTVKWHLTSPETIHVNVSLSATISTMSRNDTGGPNSSPLAPLPPYIGIQHGCKSMVKVPIIDPDDDIVTCRWATPIECGQSCSNLPHVVLDKKTCSLELDATTHNGFKPGQKYRVTLMAEDSPRKDIFINGLRITPSMKISAIPLQFVIDVKNGSGICTNTMKYVYDTLPNNERAPYPLNQPMLHNVVYLESSDTSTTKFLTSGPKGCTYQQQADNKGRNNVTTLLETCKLTPRDRVLGDALICVWGISNYLITSDARCVNIIVAGRNECYSSPCSGNETCYNLFMRYTCRCQNGNKGPSCFQDILPVKIPEPSLQLAMIAGASAGGFSVIMLICCISWYIYKKHYSLTKSSPLKQDTWASARIK